LWPSNVFSNTPTTTEQSHDLWDIGSESLKHFIDHCILNIPSANTPVRQHKLLTMAPSKTGSKRLINQKEKELKQVNKYLRLRLAWCNRTGQTYDPSSEQYSLYPRAIADETGSPVKGSKSVWKDKLRKRYSGTTPVVIDTLPSQWNPDATIIDGMFLINCKPLRQTETIIQYSLFLFKRFLLPHFQAQVKEVHLIFDTPSGGEVFNPKMFEQKRRDTSNDSVPHQHIAFTPTTKVPGNWQSYIRCRQCKRSLIEAIGLSFMQSTRFQLRDGQTLYLSGCFPGVGISSTYELKANKLSLPAPELKYKSNCDETDTRICHHVTQTSARRILVYSPDTDIYNIGLPLLVEIPHKEVIVQINVPHSLTNLYLHLNNLVTALQLDLDLASLPRPALANIFQMLFIVSGCDYISYFAGLGKAAFFNAFFQHATFITGQNLPGLLSDMAENCKEVGFLAFLRLIGTLYFKKHYSSIVSLKGVQTPQQLLHAQETSLNSTPQEVHSLWYNCIRGIVSDRIIDEKDRMPTHSSMWCHWIRSCWVACMWSNSSREDIRESLPPPESCAWWKKK